MQDLDFENIFCKSVRLFSENVSDEKKNPEVHS